MSQRLSSLAATVTAPAVVVRRTSKPERETIVLVEGGKPALRVMGPDTGYRRMEIPKEWLADDGPSDFEVVSVLALDEIPEEGLYTRKQLQGRGWTDKMIREYLGDPDGEIYHSLDRPTYLKPAKAWAKARVHREEQARGLGDTLEKNLVRREKAAAKRQKKNAEKQAAAATAKAEKDRMAELRRWLGYVEDKAKEGYLYERGVAELRRHHVEQFPDLAARLDAAVGQAKALHHENELHRWLGYVEEKAETGYVYGKGVSKLRALGVGECPDLKARLDAAIRRAGEVNAANRKARADEMAAAGQEQIFLWDRDRDGMDLPRAGQVFRHRDRILKVLERSKGRYYGEDALSFGGTDDATWQFRLTVVIASDTEAAPVLEREGARKRLAELRSELGRIFEDIQTGGESPGSHDAPVSPEGTHVDDPFNPQNNYGGGRWFVLGDDWTWAVRNNGADGDAWALNNVRTGGAGAIGWRVPADLPTQQRISAIADECERLRVVVRY